MIDKNVIDESLVFYNIDSQYRELCYKCLEEVNSNEKFRLAFHRVYEVLYEKDVSKIKPLWDIYNISELFVDNINPFVTNLMVLLGYNYHKENMEKHNFCECQINIHKKRVKECFESDLINRKYKSIRISQMLWAVYFIRTRIIEVGSLQFEYENDSVVKIHIPRKTNLDITKVKESIKESRTEVQKIYAISNYNYKCVSWLLSNQVYELLNENSNIAKFHDLFTISEGENCVNDILNFVFGIDACDDYSSLRAETSLQKIVKNQLLSGKIFYIGSGILKKELVFD